MEMDAVSSAPPAKSTPKPGQDGGFSSYAGQWVMRLGYRNFLVIRFAEAANGLGGTMSFPKTFAVIDGLFFNLSSTPVTGALDGVRIQDGRLRFAVKGEDSGASDREYAMSINDHGVALLHACGSPFQPWMLYQTDSAERQEVATDFEKNRTYSHDDCDTPSPEIQRLFETDQALVVHGGEEHAPGRNTHLTDSIKNLIVAGKVRCGADFERAAFILHHSGAPDDCLLAHTLALIAMTKGNVRAIWVAAATLDRYLQALGKPQIYGTQFDMHEDGATTQEPYNRDLVPDHIRRNLGVPPLHLQTQNIKTQGEAES